MQWIGLLLIGYAVMVLSLFFFQRTLMYPGSRGLPDPVEARALGYEVLQIESEPGLMLTHWYRAPKRAGLPTIVLLHGNAGHIGHRADKLNAPFDPDWGLFLVEYRGYGGNAGKPSEEGLIKDGLSVLDWLVQERETRLSDIILFGESLGGAVSLALAEKRAVGGIILEAAPSSVARVAQSHYWYVPARWLVLDKWDGLRRVAKIDAPLIVMHGAKDRVIPQRFGRELFDAAKDPKFGVFVEEANHLDLLDYPHVREELAKFLKRARQGQLEAAQ